MGRLVSAIVMVLLIALAPAIGMAAAIAQRPLVTANPAISFVDGWWEQEHHEQDARDRYWKLPPKQRGRYDRLQAEADRREQQRRKIEEQNNRARQEQHRLLGFDIIIR